MEKIFRRNCGIMKIMKSEFYQGSINSIYIDSTKKTNVTIKYILIKIKR